LLRQGNETTNEDDAKNIDDTSFYADRNAVSSSTLRTTVSSSISRTNGRPSTNALMAMIEHDEDEDKDGRSNASKTDIALLQQAGFSVIANSKNPFVKDRILAMNRSFCDNNENRDTWLTYQCVLAMLIA